MAKEKAKSAAEISRDSVKRLRGYIDKTAASNIPKNQYKKYIKTPNLQRVGNHLLHGWQ